MSATPLRKLLVAEDDPDIARAVSIYATRRGFVALHAANGLLAVELAERERPHVVLLDINMPGLDGRDVYTRLVQAGITKTAVVIFTTARDAQLDRIHGLSLGADDYETKPLQLDSLFRKIERLLEKKTHPNV